MRAVQAETELLDEVKRKILDEMLYDARMLLLREISLLPTVSDDHEKIRALKDPPFRGRVKKKVKEMLIDEELRRRRANKMTMIAEGAEAKRAEDVIEKRKRKMEDDKKWEGESLCFHVVGVVVGVSPSRSLSIISLCSHSRSALCR